MRYAALIRSTVPVNTEWYTADRELWELKEFRDQEEMERWIAGQHRLKPDGNFHLIRYEDVQYDVTVQVKIK